MPSSFPQFIFFGGKGGVGKTTCAAAWALSEAGAGRHVLAVSTDPAHSLGDALGIRLSWRVSPVHAGKTTLHAVELDGARAYARWLTAHRRALGDAIEHGTWLDREDVEALLRLSVPGIDELVALLEIVRLAGAARGYDVVVVDTAPTGHTLRLLAAPATVGAVAEALDVLQHEHRMIRRQLARVGRPEAADRLIELLADDAREIQQLLRDRKRTRFAWVMLPEALSVAETEDGLRALATAKIPVCDVIVNRVLPAGAHCAMCDRRRTAERAVVASLGERLPVTAAMRIVNAERSEPRGAAALARIGRQLRSIRRGTFSAGRAGTGVRPLFLSVPRSARTSRPSDLRELQGARLLMIGGKGGVGKTTVAAAAALALARDNPEKTVTLLSTDPAHSLGDALGITVGDRRRQVPGAPKNLHVREVDAAAALARRRGDLAAALTEIAATFGSGGSLSAAAEGVEELMELAPPGIDELFGLLEVADELQAPESLVVVDTAPTGHALRLLETPEAVREWAQVLMRMLLKYRQVVRPGQLAVELLELSKSIRSLQDLLRDSAATRFIVVTRAAAVPRLETERLLQRLRRLRLAVPALVVNAATLAPGRCRWCRSVATAERRELALMTRAARRLAHECAIILTPLAAPAPRGVDALERWAAAWSRNS